MSKMADLRRRLPEIAEHRLRGATWPDIAKILAEAGLRITADELRPYWARLAGERHPAEILLEIAEARVEEAERQAAASRQMSSLHLRSLAAAAGTVREVNKLRAQVDALTKRNEELEAIEPVEHDAERAADEAKGLRQEMNTLLSRNAELEALVAKTRQAEWRAAEKVAEIAEEAERLRRQVNDLQERSLELEAARTSAEKARQWAESRASTFEALSDLLYAQRNELEARTTELEADLAAVNMMSLGLGIGRKARRQLRRHVAA
jgi:chromosome segregation ATPase